MNVLITAGPTREYLDDVRYLSNASTGRMGYALATAAKEAGHEVTLVHGPTAESPPPVHKAVPVTSAEEMLAAAQAEFSTCDVLIACAAVSDYRPRERRAGKIARHDTETLTIELVRNPDIVATLAARRSPGQTVIGFALESDKAEAGARRKLAEKKLDAIALNSPGAIGAADTEITVFFCGEGEPETVRGSKEDVAKRLVAIAERLAEDGKRN